MFSGRPLVAMTSPRTCPQEKVRAYTDQSAPCSVCVHLTCAPCITGRRSALPKTGQKGKHLSSKPRNWWEKGGVSRDLSAAVELELMKVCGLAHAVVHSWSEVAPCMLACLCL